MQNGAASRTANSPDDISAASLAGCKLRSYEKRDSIVTCKALNSLALQYLGKPVTTCLEGSARNLRSTETNLLMPLSVKNMYR